MSRNQYRWAMLALLIVAFALRLYRLDYQELRGDETFGYFFSLRPLPEIVQATVELQEPHPVASYYLQHEWLALAGHSEFALRFSSVWFGVAAVALLAALGRALLARGATVVAAAILALSPYAIWHSQDARMYSMSLALTLASTVLMVRWLQRQEYRLAFSYVVVALLALHTHYFAAFVLVAQNIFVIIRLVGQPRLWRTTVNWGILQVTVAFFYGPWLLRVQGILGGYGGNGDSPTLGAMLVRSLSVFAVGESVPVGQQRWWALLALCVLLMSAWQLLRQGDRGQRALTLLWLYLVVPLVATWWSARTRPIFNERYLVAALPAFCLLVGAATYSLKKYSFHAPAWNAAPRRHPPLGADALRPYIHKALPAITALLALLYFGGSTLSLYHHYTDPAYSKTRGWRALAATLENWSAGLPPEQVRIAQNFPDPTLWYYYQGPVDHVVLPPQPHDSAGAVATVEGLVAASVQRVILPQQPAPNWDDGTIATTVLETMFVPVYQTQVGTWPVALYHRPVGALEAAPVTFENGVQLQGYGVQPSHVAANGILVVSTTWAGSAPVDGGDLKLFLQLLDANGQLVAQTDRPFPVGALATAEPAHYAILLPETLAAGPYRLIAGLYDGAAEGLPRVLTTEGADFVELTALEVVQSDSSRGNE